MEFIAATQNKGKLKELKRILEKMGHSVTSQKEAGCDIDVEETGTTFEENALLKAKAVCEASGKATIADDSGLVVEYLNGEPGVYSARYSGKHGDEIGCNNKLLLNMQGAENRKAKFVSAVCVYLPNGSHLTAMGECHGYVGTEPHGNNGFGYDPIFNIKEYQNKSYAELSDKEKDTISHRGKALEALQKALPNFLHTKNLCAASVAIIGGNNVNK